VRGWKKTRKAESGNDGSTGNAAAPDFGALVWQELTKCSALDRQCERAAPVMKCFAKVVDGEFLHCKQQYGVCTRRHSAPAQNPALARAFLETQSGKRGEGLEKNRMG
jgi:hypothetical protein